MRGDTSPTILIVDDEPSTVDLLEAILTPDNRILRACSGTEGLQMATTQHPDLILLDIMLPDISGHDICLKLKNTDGTRFIPIIIITAMAEREEKIKSLENGADDFINKPAKASIIRKRVHSLLKIKFLRDKLIQERNLARKYIDVAGSPMLTIGRDLNVYLVNRKTCKILGYDKEDIVGKNWFDMFIPKDEVNKQREYFLELLKEPVELPDTIQNTVLTKSGDRKLIEWHYVILKDEDDKPTEVLMSGEDIT
ncbi:MAG: response regulator, partial [Methanosarcinaceae archaeon]